MINLLSYLIKEEIFLTFYNNKQIQSIILKAYTKPKYKVNLLDNNKAIIKEHSGVCVDDL